MCFRQCQGTTDDCNADEVVVSVHSCTSSQSHFAIDFCLHFRRESFCNAFHTTMLLLIVFDVSSLHSHFVNRGCRRRRGRGWCCRRRRRCRRGSSQLFCTSLQCNFDKVSLFVFEPFSGALFSAGRFAKRSTVVHQGASNTAEEQVLEARVSRLVVIICVRVFQRSIIFGWSFRKAFHICASDCFAV